MSETSRFGTGRPAAWRALALVLCGIALTGHASSQTSDTLFAPLRPSLSAGDPPTEPACGAQASIFASGGMRLWVIRRGSVEQDNPLRPLSRDKLVVLQVAVNGRLATAYGPDFDNMRQGGSVQKLEEETGRTVRWEAEAASLPAFIRVVAEDGRVLLGPLAFQGCGPAPKTATSVATKPSSRAAPSPRSESAPTDPPQTSAIERRRPASRPTLPLPQGAIQ